MACRKQLGDAGLSPTNKVKLWKITNLATNIVEEDGPYMNAQVNRYQQN